MSFYDTPPELAKESIQVFYPSLQRVTVFSTTMTVSMIYAYYQQDTARKLILPPQNQYPILSVMPNSVSLGSFPPHFVSSLVMLHM